MASLKNFSKFFAVTFFLVSLTLITAVSAHYYYYSKISPLTYLAGSHIGSVNFQQLDNKITPILSTLEKKPITIIYDQSQVSFTQQELGIKINQQKTLSQLTTPSTQFGWASVNYWKKFLTVQRLHPSFDINEEQFKSTLETSFGKNIVAKNAEIRIVNNNELQISEAVNGNEIDLASLKKEIRKVFAGQLSLVILQRKTTAPLVTNTKALQAKSEILAKVTSVKLSTDTGKVFTILPSDIYPAIKFTIDKTSYKWSVDQKSMESIVNDKIGKELVVKVIDRTIDINTKRLITAGRDGTSIPTKIIAQNIILAINNHIDTDINPITVPVEKVKFTEKLIDGSYRLNMTDGLYVYINLAKQRLYVIEKDKLINNFIISSGKGERATPKGVYYIKNKIAFTYSRAYPNIWLRRWNALSRNIDGSGYYGYGIHDLPCMDKQCNEIRGASTLGQPASFGCIRLGTSNAIWFFENIPVKTPVYIY
ncbi:L,D-transpeptidase [Candidatus Berkelbacteria bacterium]|nr:L,D-transpeptidase [Candidatus Berkelbacteria bacterium]